MVARIASTREGKEKLEVELKRLRAEERPKIIAAIEKAREHGDLSENAEYSAAKEAQQHLTQRIQEIEDCLSRLEVIDLRRLEGTEKISFGATVTLLELEIDARKTYQIVGGHESDIPHGRISIQSPVGSALIGKREGDIVPIKTPRGVVEYEVIKIAYV